MSNWCNKYNMWCDEVEDLMDGENDCDCNCRSCEYKERVK